jgi:hypothetical protein
MAFLNSQIVIVPDARWAALRAWYLTQGFEIGDGVPLGPNSGGPITHRAFHSWMADALVAAAEAAAPPQRQNDVANDLNSQSNKQARWTALRGSLTPVTTA